MSYPRDDSLASGNSDETVVGRPDDTQEFVDLDGRRQRGTSYTAVRPIDSTSPAAVPYVSQVWINAALLLRHIAVLRMSLVRIMYYMRQARTQETLDTLSQFYQADTMPFVANASMYYLVTMYTQFTQLSRLAPRFTARDHVAIAIGHVDAVVRELIVDTWLFMTNSYITVMLRNPYEYDARATHMDYFLYIARRFLYDPRRAMQFNGSRSRASPNTAVVLIRQFENAEILVRGLRHLAASRLPYDVVISLALDVNSSVVSAVPTHYIQHVDGLQYTTDDNMLRDRFAASTPPDALANPLNLDLQEADYNRGLPLVINTPRRLELGPHPVNRYVRDIELSVRPDVLPAHEIMVYDLPSTSWYPSPPYDMRRSNTDVTFGPTRRTLETEQFLRDQDVNGDDDDDEEEEEEAERGESASYEETETAWEEESDI